MQNQLCHPWSCLSSFDLTQTLRLTEACSFFSDKKLNIIGQLFNDNGKIKPWEYIKIEFHLKDTQRIYWLKIIDALPKSWKDAILKDKGNAKNLVISDYHIVRKSEICSLNNLTSKYC